MSLTLRPDLVSTSGGKVEQEERRQKTFFCQRLPIVKNVTPLLCPPET